MAPLDHEQSIYSLERCISSAQLLAKERLIMAPAFNVRLPKGDFLLGFVFLYNQKFQSSDDNSIDLP
jgi:hypothetical protein